MACKSTVGILIHALAMMYLSRMNTNYRTLYCWIRWCSRNTTTYIE